MTSNREQVNRVLHVLTGKRTRLVEELRDLDRQIALIEHLNTDNYQLRSYIQTVNRRRREEAMPASEVYKRVRSPTFSDCNDGGEDDDILAGLKGTNAERERG